MKIPEQFEPFEPYGKKAIKCRRHAAQALITIAVFAYGPEITEHFTPEEVEEFKAAFALRIHQLVELAERGFAAPPTSSRIN